MHTLPRSGVSQNERVAVLYRRYGPVIFARCRRLLKDASLAEDATQEVFVRVLRHIESAPDDAQALAWIYRITTNWCLNALRDRSRQAEATGSLPELPTEHPEPGMLDRDAAMRLVASAPEKIRSAVVLYYVDGLEQTKVADVLGVSRRTVINWLNDFGDRSRKRLARDAR
jgi:RNA polymerase sigma-70 factor (ECF subfamily)